MAAWLTALIGALAKIATDVVFLSATEVGEVNEAPAPGRGGSSAMPHKQNPVSATVILAAHTAATGALAALTECGGGFVVVKDGAVLARLPLPLGGLMSLEEPAEIARALEELRSASKAIGCVLPEPFLQLAFLSLPVIPSLKLTDRGLMDVDAFQLIDVRAA